MSMQQPATGTTHTREEALNAIINSIAMEEVALSHLITAENEKIKYVTECSKKDCNAECIQNVLKVNESATALMEQIKEVQLILKNKLQLAVNNKPPEEEKPDPPIKPDPPVRPPRPESCRNEFGTGGRHTWFCGSVLYLEENCRCGGGVRLTRRNCGNAILLPANKRYRIEMELCVTNKCSAPITVGLELFTASESAFCKSITNNCRDYKSRITESMVIDTSDNCRRDYYLSVSLNTPESLTVTKGVITVTELDSREC